MFRSFRGFTDIAGFERKTQMAFNQKLDYTGCYMVDAFHPPNATSLTSRSGPSTVHWSIRIRVDKSWPTSSPLDCPHDILRFDRHCQCKSSYDLVQT